MELVPELGLASIESLMICVGCGNYPLSALHVE